LCSLSSWAPAFATISARRCGLGPRLGPTRPSRKFRRHPGACAEHAHQQPGDGEIDVQCWPVQAMACAEDLDGMAKRNVTGRSVERIDRRSRKNGATGNATVTAMLRLTLVLAFTCAATAAAARDCDVVEPDSLQISWTAPCEDGSWLLDPQA